MKLLEPVNLLCAEEFAYLFTMYPIYATFTKENQWCAIDRLTTRIDRINTHGFDSDSLHACSQRIRLIRNLLYFGICELKSKDKLHEID